MDYCKYLKIRTEAYTKLVELEKDITETTQPEKPSKDATETTQPQKPLESSDCKYEDDIN